MRGLGERAGTKLSGSEGMLQEDNNMRCMHDFLYKKE